MEDVRELVAEKLYLIAAEAIEDYSEEIYGTRKDMAAWKNLTDAEKECWRIEADQILAIEVAKGYSLQELIKLACEGRLEVRADNQDLPCLKYGCHFCLKHMKAMSKGDKDTHWVKCIRR